MASSQERSESNKKDTMKQHSSIAGTKPEILSSGFIDIVSNGQLNASARFTRLFIGEPGKFAIPLSVYSGVSSNSFQNPQMPGGIRSNDQLVPNFINPMSGLVNVSVEGLVLFSKRWARISKWGWSYHFGSRVLTGYETTQVPTSSAGRPVNFINSYGTSGIYLQTGAWERNNARELGVFWFNGRYILCKSGKRQLRMIIPGLAGNGLYHGWSLAWGVEINNLVNIKVIYYKYVKAPEIDYSIPVYQFSFNYSMR
jgi:hypothetical protein